ncbi:putative porin [Cellulophaga sp. HaHaR_3_176]|uniref:putative porin n=1 Tax=Cellulophaga sp. HaHaR_3_176 TaxID=1942464 RepID=UPI001C1FCA0B|nr:putative porin [Cellulophaga sp. HaHaR_3_176]QWX83069.1 putative porin [Cellulophaga sp. HaHaR_3_176]
MRQFFIIFFVFNVGLVFSQDRPTKPGKDSNSLEKKDKEALGKKNDSIQKKPSIDKYKIISFKRDTTFLDTTLTISKEYKNNYLRKDNFELLPFSNMGQTYNSLSLKTDYDKFYPFIGANAKHYNYKEIEDINYYNVPTPTTDVMFKTVFSEGQFLDIMLTFNTSERLNYSIAYTGFRSFGKYNSTESEAGNFITTTNYESKNKRYNLRAHIAVQDLENQENGGISNKDQFESGDSEFQDRIGIDVFFNDVDTKILGKRYFFENQYKLVKKEGDSSAIDKTSLSLGHVFNYETRFYEFTQTTQNDYFGDAFVSGEISDKARLKSFYNQLSAEFYNTTLGRLKGFVNVYNYNYYFNTFLIQDDGLSVGKLKGEEISLGANYEKKIGDFDVKGNLTYNLSGNLTGTLLNGSAGYRFNDDMAFHAHIHSSSRMPDFNYLLYQSDYANYNWSNENNFEKVNTNIIGVDFESKLLGDASVEFTTLDNYTYFAVDPLVTIEEGGFENQYIKPYQESNSISHLKVKYRKEFKYGKFALDNTIMYQAVSQSNDVLNVPQFTARNTLYFSKEIFDKAMFLQTGVTFKYFTSYNMNSFNPLLGEFYIQNNETLGGFPLIDLFINAKIQQTRLYLKAEHINSSFTGNNYYSAPSYPYRDFIVRFGVVWNFFS